MPIFYANSLTIRNLLTCKLTLLALQNKFKIIFWIWWYLSIFQRHEHKTIVFLQLLYFIFYIFRNVDQKNIFSYQDLNDLNCKNFCEGFPCGFSLKKVSYSLFWKRKNLGKVSIQKIFNILVPYTKVTFYLEIKLSKSN